MSGTVSAGLMYSMRMKRFEGQTCNATFVTYTDANVLGLYFVNGLTTAYNCKTWCWSNVSCVSVDFSSTTSTCWATLNPAPYNSSSYTVVHYVPDRANCTTPTQPITCKDNRFLHRVKLTRSFG